MNPMDILLNIIEHDGSCGWVDASRDCPHCPLARLRKRDDGTFLSCLEAVGADYMPEEAVADALYKEAAERLLLDSEMEKILLSQPAAGETDGA